MNTSEPMTLKYRCTTALRLAAFDAPMDAMSGVEHVPMFCPRMMGTALPHVTRPVADSACRMPTDADDDWMATVTRMPARTPSSGFCSEVNSWMNSGESRSGSTDEVIVSMPVNSRPKPIMIWPMLRFFGAFRNTYKIAPMNATIGAKLLGLHSSSSRLPPEMSDKRISWPVTVVPMFAPMMTPMACDSCMMPEFTRPMTMTVVPADDWMMPVMTAPSATALTVDDVRRRRMPSIFPPAIFSRPEPMMLMPYRNSAMPPARPMTLNMLM